MSHAKTSFPTALTIAGSDASGGAGIQADLKTFHRFGVYGTSALTLVTAQNTQGVRGVHVLDPVCVASQIAAIVEDLGVDAAKTGALGSASVVGTVADAVSRHPFGLLVVDPILAATDGRPLLDTAGLRILRERLLPRATLLTPNLAEAGALSGIPVHSEPEMREAARRLHALGARAVLVKGGHLVGEEAVDLFFDGDEFVRLSAPKRLTRHTHGSGCTYSAAITARLALGEALLPAVRTAKAYLTRAIATAPGLGKGHGPLNHWA